MIPLPASSARRLAAEAAWPGCGRRACRSAANTASVPSSASTLIAAATSAVVSSRRRSARASTSMPSMPSVPLISARPSFSASCDRLDAVRRAAPRRPGSSDAGGVAHLALAHQRERDRRQRREVAGAAERAVLVHDRRDAGVEHARRRPGRSPAGRRCGRWPGSTAAAASARAPPRARPRGRSRRRASGSGCAAAGRAARAGCAWWPGRRSRWRCRSAAGRRSARPSTTSRLRAIAARASSASRTPAPSAGDADDVLRGDRADADDYLVGAAWPHRTPPRRPPPGLVAQSCPGSQTVRADVTRDGRTASAGHPRLSPRASRWRFVAQLLVAAAAYAGPCPTTSRSLR